MALKLPFPHEPNLEASLISKPNKSITMSINVESDLKEILDKLERKIDNLQSDVSGLRQQDIPTINVKLENLSTRMSHVEKTVDKVSTNQETIQKDVGDLKGAKSLIIPIVVAITTSILTLVIRAIPIS